MPEIPVTALHNYMQNRGMLHLLSYADIPSGPCDQQVWTIQCKINGAVMGVGTGRDKQQARRLAAQQALQVIRSESH
ncbi:hypothetical protein FA15DRAFT_667216 [Coprinopsis marcescibilis]|uniref:DRBM domain-containing protein n=1 Tax=Coprinopsis marcescibilis TaxID=230819 RepID=A0A5C3L3I8_COPMA|nr:hypothetical protein FA15DRAFT_667216 [Coprinopsis marcescibilis]